MVTTDNTGISAEAIPGATPAHELDLLAAVYKFILQCGEESRAAGAYGGADARKEESNASG
jgi:hypothetical protein